MRGLIRVFGMDHMSNLRNSSTAWQRFKKHKAALFSLYLLGVLITAVLVLPEFSPHTYETTDWGAIFSAPTWNNGHWFGTDELGRDVFVRTLIGGRVSILVALLASTVSVVIGVSYGALAGFIGGRVDQWMMRWVDILYSLPFMFFAILLMTFFGRHLSLLFIAIGAISWLDMSRIVRGQTLSLKHKEFIEAARVCGVRTPQIIWRHIVPNTLGIVAIYTTLTIPSVILTESFLSFLGLGVQEPLTSWGVLINQGAQNMSVAWWTLIFPAVFLISTLYCCHFIGDGLRDAFDPKDNASC